MFLNQDYRDAEEGVTSMIRGPSSNAVSVKASLGNEVSTVRGSGWVPILPIFDSRLAIGPTLDINRKSAFANRQSLHPSATADGTDFMTLGRLKSKCLSTAGDSSIAARMVHRN